MTHFTNPHTRRPRDILQSFGLNWSVNSPTRVCATASTTIDNVITNIPKVDVVVFNPAISDHFAHEVVINGLDPVTGLAEITVNRALNPQSINALLLKIFMSLQEIQSTQFYLDYTRYSHIS
ncbi:hypothetical protein J6590_017658 [Homalodisca vitripennis]|nr:hypothetical protein J6590_017658 [Homalodisca vitripennis]